jgi:hypothetical protein
VIPTRFAKRYRRRPEDKELDFYEKVLDS